MCFSFIQLLLFLTQRTLAEKTINSEMRARARARVRQRFVWRPKKVGPGTTAGKERKRSQSGEKDGGRVAASRASGFSGEAGSQLLVQEHQDSRSTAGIVTQQDPPVSERV